MYDTLSMFLPAEKVPSVDLLAELPNKLTEVKENLTLSSGARKANGLFNQLFVSISLGGVFLSGSLPKQYFGHNQSTLSIENTKDAIAMLSDGLSLPLAKAFVWRIDFAENYNMSHPPASYFESLGNCSYFDRLDQGSSLYYNSGRRTMVFYDKVKELNAKKYSIVSEFEGQHILRYEYRLQKRIADQLKHTKVKTSDLYEPTFYKKLLLRYQSEYASIEKFNFLAFDSEVIGDVKALRNQLSLQGIQAYGGEKAVLEMLEAAKKRGEFSNDMQYGRSRKMVRELCSKPVLTSKSDFIAELDFKINERVQNELASL